MIVHCTLDTAPVNELLHSPLPTTCYRPLHLPVQCTLDTTASLLTLAPMPTTICYRQLNLPVRRAPALAGGGRPQGAPRQVGRRDQPVHQLGFAVRARCRQPAAVRGASRSCCLLARLSDTCCSAAEPAWHAMRMSAVQHRSPSCPTTLIPHRLPRRRAV